MSERPTLWWYASGEQKFGPYSEAQLRDLAQAGHVGPNDLVWHHGLTDWVPATTIEALLPATPVMPPAAGAPATPLDSPPDLPIPWPGAPNASDASNASATGPKLETDAPRSLPSWLDAVLPKTEKATAHPHSPSPADPLALFVGENYSFYARRWAESDQRFGGKLSWNWAAFFLGPIWMVYRKMYAHCAALLAASLVLTAIAQASGASVEDILKWQMQAGPAISFLLGLFGNWLYRLHAERKVRQIIDASGHSEQARLLLARQGGVNLTTALALLTLVVLAWLMGPKP
ncbi:MAG: GYF domain-containing protein [Brachymonas sp.]|nr:GYF domain-containing protein [Brachymonas sp.]